MSALADMLMRQEGEGPSLPAGNYKLYRDSVGKLTGGWGHNYDDEGISPTVAAFQLEEDIAKHQADLRRHCPWFSALDDVRQDAITSMVFNMGITRFLRFHKTIAALEQRDWHTASVEMLDSAWAQQVGKRATELSAMIDTGVYQA